MRAECTCPIPCSFLIFDPALSFATTSAFATDRLLAAASRTNDLETKYLLATETTQRMEEIKFQRFVRMEKEAQRRLQHLSALMLHEVRDSILLTESVIRRVSNGMRAVWESKDYLYRWQAFHVQKNFIRPRDAMNERTFGYLVLGFQQFANLTESQIWTLADANITSADVRKTLYTLIMTALTAKMDLCDRAFANYTQLHLAYYNGTPVFRYKFETEPRNDNVYISPRPLLRNSLFHSAYVTKYSSRVGVDILKYKAAVSRFAELAAGAYENGTLEKDDMYNADVRFLWRGRRYLHSKSIFDYESVEFPLRVLQDRMTSFERLWRNFEAISQESLGSIESLKVSLENLEGSILERLNHSMQMAREYVASGNVTKLEIAKELTSQNIYVGISDLKVFFQSLRSRGQNIYDNWDKMAEATNKIWHVVIEDIDMIDYYLYKNLTHFLRNVSEVALETRAEYENFRQQYDFRFLVGSSDSLFLKSLADIMSDMESYLKASIIETDFIRRVTLLCLFLPACLPVCPPNCLFTCLHACMPS